MTRGGRVVVIGGGVIGVCSAYYLVRKGYRVTVIEKGDICAGSSFGNAGLVVPSHSIPLAAPGVLGKALRWLLDPESPFYVKPRPSLALLAWLWRFRGACTAAHVHRAMPIIRDLSYASLELYRELAAVRELDFGFEQRGLLVVFRTGHGLEEGVEEARLLGAAGVPAKVLDGPGARALEPNLSPDVAGAVFFPDDAQLVPDRFVKGLARVAEKGGACILTGTEALGFRTAGGRVLAVETSRGEIACDEVVLAAGSWSPGVAAGLGLRLPIQPAKGYSLTCPRPVRGPARPLILAEAKVAVTPMGEALRFAGTLELAGLDASINRRRVEAIRRAAAVYLADAGDLSGGQVWAGLRPCTPDGLPIIGRTWRPENLVVATGHAMIGVSTGPITGKLVAQLIAGEPPAVSLEALAPGRFG